MFGVWVLRKAGRKGVNGQMFLIFPKWCERQNQRNAYPRVVHSNSAGSPWMLWDGLLWCSCCSDPGSAGQDSTQPVSVHAPLSSTAFWSGISFWMSVLTSEIVSQPCTRVSGLRGDRERESGIDRKGDYTEGDYVLYRVRTRIHHIFKHALHKYISVQVVCGSFILKGSGWTVRYRGVPEEQRG